MRTPLALYQTSPGAQDLDGEGTRILAPIANEQATERFHLGRVSRLLPPRIRDCRARQDHGRSREQVWRHATATPRLRGVARRDVVGCERIVGTGWAPRPIEAFTGFGRYGERKGAGDDESEE